MQKTRNVSCFLCSPPLDKVYLCSSFLAGECSEPVVAYFLNLYMLSRPLLTKTQLFPFSDQNLAMENKNKTVGVSFPPALRQRAGERSQAPGLSFSRYVQMCVEADLNGQAPALLHDDLTTKARPQVNVQKAPDEGEEHSTAKAAGSGFADDIEEILKSEGLCYQRLAKVAQLRADFLITHLNPATDVEVRLALECTPKIRQRYTIAPGQAIILQSIPPIDGVILCVPYLKNFDEQVRDTFTQHGIPVATPDNVIEVINEVISSVKK